MEERTIIITGAGNGFGFHLALVLAESGFRVAALDLQESESVLQHQSDTLIYLPCDVTDPAQIERAVAAVRQRWGRVDILVNNAVLALYAPFEEKNPEDTRREFEVNYFGALNMIAAVLPLMKGQGRGIIYNVSSGVGLTGFKGISGYTSTKGALEALTLTLRLELEPYGIAVGVIHPPLMRTASSSFLPLPPQVMEDPDRAAQKIARKIGSTRPVLTPDLRTALYLYFARRRPHFFGRLFSSLTDKSAAKDKPE